MNKEFTNTSTLLLFCTFGAIFFVSLSVSAVPLIVEGVRKSADMYHFLMYVDSVLEKETLGEVLLAVFTEPWARLYSTWLFLLSGTVYVAGEDWPIAIAILNIVFHALTITLASVFIFIVTRKVTLTILNSILLTFSIDVLIRVNWAISDSLFFLTATGAFIMVSIVLFRPKNLCLVILAALAVLVAGLTRPHGIAILVIGITALLMRDRLSKISSKASISVVAVFVLGLLLSFVVVAFVFGPNYEPITTEDEMLQTHLLKGIVIEGVYSSYHTGTDEFSVRLFIIFDRLVTFFSFFPQHWGTKHILLSSWFFLPWYIAFIGCWAIVCSRDIDSRIRCLILFSTIWILAVAAYAGWAHVSYEHRYRFPLMPVFAFQTILGVYLCIPLDKLLDKSKKWAIRTIVNS